MVLSAPNWTTAVEMIDFLIFLISVIISLLYVTTKMVSVFWPPCLFFDHPCPQELQRTQLWGFFSSNAEEERSGLSRSTSADMSSPSKSPSSSSSNNVSIGAAVVASIIAFSVVAIVIAKLITKCCLAKKTQQSNESVPTTNDAANSDRQTSSSPVETTPILKSSEWSIEVTPMERFLDEFLKEKPMRFTPQHLIDITQNYSNKLGSGGFGAVYKGQFPNGVAVAVKVLHRALDKGAEEQFMAEVATIGRTYHINLVRLYGFCFDAEVKALVYEYMENGSLDKYLFDKSKRPEWGKLFEIAVGTAKGIRYLHEECRKRVVHYDIKPGNILLDSSFSPKVGDFGLAKLSDRENSHVTLTGGRGTPGYAAPELWMPYPVTYKCDVYSYGMLLFEIVGARRNLDFSRTESQEWFPRWVWEKFEQGGLDNIVELCGAEGNDTEKAGRLCKVALWCVQYQPEIRPSMSNVVRMLEGEQEIVRPVNPFLRPVVHSLSTTPWSESSSGVSSEKMSNA